ncbi:glucosamine-6-phosphate deaminase 1 [Spirochaetia bacterium]|nr:glucosamine-6-phosphate deaminase 1 [Spirochaetia bacterium]
MNKACPCPYLPCKLRNNCEACIKKNRQDETLCNCMERTAKKLGAVPLFHYPATVLCVGEAEVAKTCADIIARRLKEKPDALLCFPAGESARGTFAELVRMAREKTIDFSRARFVQLDEWLDLEDEQENCGAFLRRNFYGPAGIRDEQITLFDIHAADMNDACRLMDQYIAGEGPIDIMLLGLGMNGHLGLNEPGVNWDNYSVVVDLDETTKKVGQKYFSGSMKLSRGITLGMRYMFESTRVILQVMGEKKAGILRDIYSTAPVMDLPGTVMQLLHDGLVVTDEKAAALLDRDLLHPVSP